MNDFRTTLSTLQILLTPTTSQSTISKAMLQTKMVPAAPTLMCIPSECRLRIFEFALADAFNEIVVYSPKGRSVFAWNAHQPLLSVSRQVRREALEYYNITLRITGEESLEDCGGDDYRNRLSPFIRRAISIVEIETVRGCNGQFINKDQFPNLKSILTYAEVDYTVQDGIELKEVIDGAHEPALLATI